MWRVLENVVRKLNAFWCEGILRGNMGRSKEQDKSQTTTTDESYESGEDSGFADDEGLCYLYSSEGEHHSGAQARHKHSDVENEESSENENEFVLDADVKNQQRLTLLSLLYSRALERKLNEARRGKPSYSLRKHK